MRVTDIKSNSLKTPVIIQTYKPIKNNDNIPVQVIDNTFKRKAKVSSLSLRKQEFLQGEGISSINTLEFLVRYANIDTSAKVVYKSKTYDIKAVENVEEKDKFILILGECIK